MDEKSLAIQKDFERGRKPRILFLDEEVSEAVGTFYDAHKGPILKVLQPQHLISYAWQWVGEKTIHVKALPDYKGYKPGRWNLDDKALCKDLYALIEEADLIIGHNAKRFDLKIARTRLAYHGFQPPDEGKIEDTLLILWKYFRLEKNNLDYACQFFGIMGKTKFKHSDFIDGCIEGNMKDWAGMKKYNKRDVEITKALYAKISPWHSNHFNLNLIQRGGQLCKICIANGREGKSMKRNGVRWGKTFGRQEYKCNDCGHCWRGERLEKESEKVDQFNI